MKISLTLLLALLLPAIAAATPAPGTSTATGMTGQPPILAAKSYLLFDHTTRQILLEHNSHERMAPASLTKLMAAYLTFDALRQNKLTLNQAVTPSSYAVRSERSESRLFLDRNKTVTVNELLHGLIVISANDDPRVSRRAHRIG